jgi:hypothetical protein
MRTTRPTAGPPHAFTHLIEADAYATCSGFVFLSRCNPTDPLVACQRSDVRPHVLHDRIVFDCFAEVRRHSVNGTGSKLLLNCHLYPMTLLVRSRRDLVISPTFLPLCRYGYLIILTSLQ